MRVAMQEATRQTTRFEVDYKPTSEDCLAFLRYLEELPRGPWIEFVVRPLSLLLACAALPCLLHFRSGLGWTNAILLSIVFVPILFAIDRSLERYRRQKRYRQVKAQVDNYISVVSKSSWRLIVSEEGVTLVTDENSQAWNWKALRIVDTTARHVFFLDYKNKVTIAARRLFADPAGFREFSQKVVQYHERSRAIIANHSD
jgi:hypothetical protein